MAALEPVPFASTTLAFDSCLGVDLTCSPAKVGASMCHVEVDRACAISKGQDV